jgi:transposase
MTRLYGWGPTDERVNYAAPFGHWKTTTFVAASRLGGLFAPLVVDGALNGDLFAEYVRTQLAPQLRPGDILVMDNLQTHKVKAAVDAVRAVDARVLYLPPYSPDFNPIENAFAKLKALLRKAAERSVSGLWSAIGRIIDLFPSGECANYFMAAGYDAI